MLPIFFFSRPFFFSPTPCSSTRHIASQETTSTGVGWSTLFFVLFTSCLAAACRFDTAPPCEIRPRDEASFPLVPFSSWCETPRQFLPVRSSPLSLGTSSSILRGLSALKEFDVVSVGGGNNTERWSTSHEVPRQVLDYGFKLQHKRCCSIVTQHFSTAASLVNRRGC